jgi:4-hydroxybenzoate polyprenyltransferase
MVTLCGSPVRPDLRLSGRRPDCRHGLHAIGPLGIRFALRLSAACHALTTLLLVALGLTAGLGAAYWGGVAAAGGLLAYEHAIVRPDDLRRIDLAFFNINGIISWFPGRHSGRIIRSPRKSR